MIIPSFIQSNYPLHTKNWFETGGPAQYYCEPSTIDEYKNAIKWAFDMNIAITLLGSGANVLISDAGIKGLVIKPCINSINYLTDIKEALPGQTVLVQAGAGALLEDLINYGLTNCALGLEEFSGIPGTIGGSVYINVHYFKFLISNFLHSARVICKKTGEILEVDNSWFCFGYNTSTLLRKEHFLIDATFAVKKSTQEEAEYAKGRAFEIIRHRKQRYPYKGTCGSFFRNFHENEITLEQNGKKLIYVGYYLDRVGVKGSLSFGRAAVSYQHANMIVNQGGATTADIINVARRMQELVYQSFGILPVPECELLGFDEHPLIRANQIMKIMPIEAVNFSF